MKPAVLLLLVLTALPALGGPPPWWERMAFWSWGDFQRLDAALARTELALAGLPELALINSCTRIGLKTGYTTEEDVRWMEVTLPETAQVDTVVLIPPLAKAASAVVAGYGFPLRFKVEVFDGQDAAHIVMDHTAANFPNPGCWPVVARFEPRPVSRVRFTATEPWSVDGPEILSLAEMMVLSGPRNLAIQGAVTSSSSRNAPRAWTRSNLIDMVTPLGLPLVPHAGGGKLGFHSLPAARKDERKTLTLTLPEVTPVDEIRLVPVRRRDVPLWFDYGFPELYTVEAATREDFSDAVTLLQVTDELLPSPGMNFVCIPGKKTPAKYIRITTQEMWYRKNDHVFALAEMQVFQGDENIAPRGRFTASDVLEGAEAGEWGLEALNDGLADGGRLISLPEWFAQLEQRRRLEQERTQIHTQREALAWQAQRQLVYGSVGGGGGITLLSALLLWRQHRQRRRETQRLQDKLARDLHDEIGSNLGSITLICSFASQPGTEVESMRADVLEIGRVAEETADSMRDMVDLLGARGRAEGAWLEVLRRLTERLLRGLDLDCALPTAPLTEEPDLETRRELYLFCKEVLHNIARHARASRVRFHLSPARHGLRVEITDDGAGFDPAQPATGNGLGNLRERATAMRARMELASAPGRGTSITLDLPRTPRWAASTS